MNRIFPEQLASNLNSHLAKVYFLVGTDPLLLSESEDLIHQAALLQGFDEKNQIWHCPCHQSIFDCYGKLIEGPCLKDMNKQK